MATDGTGSAGTSATSTWAPLRIGVFRGLFIAALTSNIGTWMQTVGAQWFLVESHASPTVIALVQTASLTPTLLLALFAGALADRVDRRRLPSPCRRTGRSPPRRWRLPVAGVLDAVSLLVLIFAVGCAAALTTPAWQAIQPELVPREQLRSAASLGGVAVDTARAVGPSIAGLLVAALGAAAAFAINAVSFVGVIVALLAWKRTPSEPVAARGFRPVDPHRYPVHKPKPEHAPNLVARCVVRVSRVGAVGAAARRRVSAISPARHRLWGGPGHRRSRAAIGAVLMSRLGAVLSANALLALAALVAAGGLVAPAYAPLGVAVVLLLLAGVAWIATLTTLTVAAQMTLPQPLQARGLAIYLVILIFAGDRIVGVGSRGLALRARCVPDGIGGSARAGIGERGRVAAAARDR